MKRYVIEGEWSGYHSGQRRVCHREVYKTRRKVSPFIESVRKIHAITFTDGTCLSLSVREAFPREKVQEIKGYTSLIMEAVDTGLCSVQAMYDRKKVQP